MANNASARISFFNLRSAGVTQNPNLSGRSSFFNLRSKSYVQPRIIIPTAISTDPAGGISPWSAAFSNTFGGGASFTIAADPGSVPGVNAATVFAIVENVTLIVNWIVPPTEIYNVLYMDGPSINSFYPIVDTLFNIASTARLVQAAFGMNASPNFFGLRAIGSGYLVQDVASAIGNINLRLAGNAASGQFVETQFTGVSGVSATETASTITLTWNPPGQASSFFNIKSNSTAVIGSGLTGKNYIEVVRPSITMGGSNPLRTNAGIVNHPFSLEFTQEFGEVSGIGFPFSIEFTQEFGEVSNYNFNSFFTLYCVSNAVFTAAVGASATLRILNLSSNSTAKFTTPASSVNSILNLRPVINAATYGLSATNTFNVLTTVATASIYGSTATINININCVASATPTTGFITRTNILSLSSSATFAQTQYIGRSSINFSAVGTLVQNYYFTSLVTIPLYFLSQTYLSNNISSTSKIEVLTSSIQASQIGSVRVSATLFNISAVGLIPSSSFSISNFMSLSCNGQSSFSNLANTIAQLNNLTVQLPMLPAIQTENNINILTDAPLIKNQVAIYTILADGPQINLIQSTNVSELATFNYFSVVSLGRSNVASSSTYVNYTPIISVGQNDDVSALVTFQQLYSSSSLGVGAAGLSTILSLNLVTATSPSYLITDSNDLYIKTDGTPSLFLQTDYGYVPALIQKDPASVLANINVTATASTLWGNTARLIGNININSIVQTIQQNLVLSLATIKNTFVGISGQSTTANGLATIPINFLGIAWTTRPATAISSINITPVISVAQAHTASGLASINFSVTATGGVGFVAQGASSFFSIVPQYISLFQLQAANGLATIIPLTTSNILQQNNLATGVELPTAITAQATVSQQNPAASDDAIEILSLSLTTGIRLTTPASGVNSINLNVSATASVNGSAFSGVNSLLTLVDPGVLTVQQQDLVSANLNINFKGGANLWKTPFGFQKGKIVIWWSE